MSSILLGRSGARELSFTQGEAPFITTFGRETEVARGVRDMVVAEVEGMNPRSGVTFPVWAWESGEAKFDCGSAGSVLLRTVIGKDKCGTPRYQGRSGNAEICVALRGDNTHR